MSKEIQDLVIRFKKTNDEAILNLIAKEFRPRLRALAVKMSAANADDLTQHGLSYLTYYLDKYDPTRKILFSTFFIGNVKGRMQHYLRDFGRTIRISRHAQELVKAYYTAQDRHHAIHGKYMTIEEYASIKKCDPAELRNKLQKYKAMEYPSRIQFYEDTTVDKDSTKELDLILKKIDAHTLVQELITHYETHNSLEMYFDNPKQTAQAEKLLKNYIQKLNNR
jgi:DNA-directed RNA polymerase specialized sigma subunit